MYEGQKPEDDLNAYDSEQVLEYLGPSIRGVRKAMPASNPSREDRDLLEQESME
jgi:hypothetical protein